MQEYNHHQFNHMKQTTPNHFRQVLIHTAMNEIDHRI